MTCGGSEALLAHSGSLHRSPGSLACCGDAQRPSVVGAFPVAAPESHCYPACSVHGRSRLRGGVAVPAAEGGSLAR